MRITVQDSAFDPAQELAQFGTGRRDIGAVVSFTGLVRDDGGTLQALEIEHYPGMTERALTQIAEDATRRWDLADVLVLHRHGTLTVGEPIMMVATAARHRAAAFAAADFLMDYLKSRAPFWKREITASGTSWVAAKDSDEEALTRW
jgi:molybdopterin synthase catalytic subunit